MQGGKWMPQTVFTSQTLLKLLRHFLRAWELFWFWILHDIFSWWLPGSGGVHLCSNNKSLSKEGQGLLLTVRSVCDKGSTSPRCLKILSYILNVSSSSRRWSDEALWEGKNARFVYGGWCSGVFLWRKPPSERSPFKFQVPGTQAVVFC